MQPPTLFNPRTFPSPPEETQSPWAVTPILLSQPLATTNLLSVSMDLSVVDISYKWILTLWGVLWLVSSTQHDVFKVTLFSIYFYFILLKYFKALPGLESFLFLCHLAPKMMGIFIGTHDASCISQFPQLSQKMTFYSWCIRIRFQTKSVFGCRLP